MNGTIQAPRQQTKRTLYEVKVEVYKFVDITVIVDLEKQTATATDGYFGGSGCIGYDGELVAITNDITTNYSEVAMAIAMRRLGLKVKAVRPMARNLFDGKPRRFKILSVSPKIYWETGAVNDHTEMRY